MTHGLFKRIGLLVCIVAVAAVGAGQAVAGAPGTIDEFVLTTPNALPREVADGSDGALWFTLESGFPNGVGDLNNGGIGRMTTSGVPTEYPIPQRGGPKAIAAGPDGALWYTGIVVPNDGLNWPVIGRVTTGGTFSSFLLPNSRAQPSGIVAGPDGALWFTDGANYFEGSSVHDRIWRMTTSGAFTFYELPTAFAASAGIAVGSDSNIWFVEQSGNKVGRLVPATGAITEFPIPTPSSQPIDIAAGPDGNMWFGEGASIAKITPTGEITEFPVGFSARGFAGGPDGNVWFVALANSQLGKITPSGAVTTYDVPNTGNSNPPLPLDVTVGSDGNMWVTERSDNELGRFNLAALSHNQPPTASFTYSPGSPTPNASVAFNASASSDPDSDPLTYAWSIDGGVVVTSMTPFFTWSFTTTGPHTVSLTVTDPSGGSDTDTQTVTVAAPVNHAPTASFTFAPASPQTGDSVSFDASASSDQDGDPLTYEWRVDGGDVGSTTSPQFTYVFTTGGAHTVTLVAHELAAASEPFSQTVTVNTRPSASFTYTPANPYVGDAVTFDASGSSDADGDSLTFRWSFDGQPSVESPTPQLAKIFTVAGAHTVDLTVEDGHGGHDTYSETVTIGNHVPTAAFTYTPAAPVAGAPVAFDASGSSDADGEPLTYTWTIDGTPGAALSTPQYVHTFATSGPHIVELSVSDPSGVADTHSETITVASSNHAPTAAFTYSPSAPRPGNSVTFDGTSSSDPDGDSPLTYAWKIDGVAASTAPVFTRELMTAGPHDVSLRVNDGHGGIGNTVQTINVVANSAPTASFTYAPETPKTGDAVSFDGTGSSDPDGDTLTYLWTIDAVPAGNGPTLTHTFAVSGGHFVQLKVTDPYGGSNTSSQTLMVANRPPTASFTVSPGSPKAGAAATFDGTASSDPDGTIASYAWTFGDGSSAVGPSPSHTYAAVGTYTAALVVTDNGGATASVTKSITVVKPLAQIVKGTVRELLGYGPGVGSGSNSVGKAGLSVQLQCKATVSQGSGRSTSAWSNVGSPVTTSSGGAYSITVSTAAPSTSQPDPCPLGLGRLTVSSGATVLGTEAITVGPFPSVTVHDLKVGSLPQQLFVEGVASATGGSGKTRLKVFTSLTRNPQSLVFDSNASGITTFTGAYRIPLGSITAHPTQQADLQPGQVLIVDLYVGQNNTVDDSAFVTVPADPGEAFTAIVSGVDLTELSSPARELKGTVHELVGFGPGLGNGTNSVKKAGLSVQLECEAMIAKANGQGTSNGWAAVGPPVTTSTKGGYSITISNGPPTLSSPDPCPVGSGRLTISSGTTVLGTETVAVGPFPSVTVHDVDVGSVPQQLFIEGLVSTSGSSGKTRLRVFSSSKATPQGLLYDSNSTGVQTQAGSYRIALGSIVAHASQATQADVTPGQTLLVQLLVGPGTGVDGAAFVTVPDPKDAFTSIVAGIDLEELSSPTRVVKGQIRELSGFGPGAGIGSNSVAKAGLKVKLECQASGQNKSSAGGWSPVGTPATTGPSGGYSITVSSSAPSGNQLDPCPFGVGRLKVSSGSTVLGIERIAVGPFPSITVQNLNVGSLPQQMFVEGLVSTTSQGSGGVTRLKVFDSPAQNAQSLVFDSNTMGVITYAGAYRIPLGSIVTHASSSGEVTPGQVLIVDLFVGPGNTADDSAFVTVPAHPGDAFTATVGGIDLTE
jgi:PKD repeat protein